MNLDRSDWDIAHKIHVSGHLVNTIMVSSFGTYMIDALNLDQLVSRQTSTRTLK